MDAVISLAIELSQKAQDCPVEVAEASQAPSENGPPDEDVVTH